MLMGNNLEAVSQESQHSEQAIYACLASVFDEEEAILALKSWGLHTNGTGSEFSGVNTFAREICNQLNKPEKHRELAKALNRALIVKYSPPIISRSTKQLSSEPSENTLSKPILAIKNLGIPSLTEHATGTYDFLTFQLVLLALIEHIALQGETTKSKAVTFLNEITETMPWSEIQQEQILALINEGSIQSTRTYKLDQLKNFLKYLKSWMVDEMGLAGATKAVDQVIEEVAKRDEVKEFDPRDLF